jgi:predicted small secreted protein
LIFIATDKTLINADKRVFDMKYMVWISVVLIALTLTACNTVNGVGKDLEKAGEAVQKSTK